MLLTKIWAAILACLATAFLAGMFLLSFGTAGGFTDALVGYRGRAIRGLLQPEYASGTGGRGPQRG